MINLAGCVLSSFPAADDTGLFFIQTRKHKDTERIKTDKIKTLCLSASVFQIKNLRHPRHLRLKNERKIRFFIEKNGE